MPTLRRLSLLAEAFVALALASALIACVPFRRVAGLAGAGARARRRPATPAQAAAIERALDGWGRRVPWRAVCFQRGLAAQLMLRRRGLAAALHYGAARDEGRLITHVWVRSGEVDVIGHRNARQFGVLAVFPAPERAGPLLDTHRRPQLIWPATAEPDQE